MNSLTCCAITSSLLLFFRPHCRMGVVQPICLALWESLGQALRSLIPLTTLPRHTLASCFFLKFATTYLPSVYMLVQLSVPFSPFRIRLKKQYHKTFTMCSIVQLLIPLFLSILHSLTGLRQPWRCITVGGLPFHTFSVFYTVFMCIGSVNIHIHLTCVY